MQKYDALAPIRNECAVLIDELKKTLRLRLCCATSDSDGAQNIIAGCDELRSLRLNLALILGLTAGSRLASTSETADAVNILLMLGDDADSLSDTFVERAEKHLRSQMDTLKYQCRLKRGDADVIKDKVDLVIRSHVHILEWAPI